MGDLDMRTSPDEDVLAAALDAGRVLISADTDFGELLAASNADGRRSCFSAGSSSAAHTRSQL